MNRIFSFLLSLAGEFLPFLGSGKRNSWIAGILLIAANLTVIPGVVFFRWSPWIILYIYWGESLIIGVLNVARMLLCGAVSGEGRFSPFGLAGALSMALFFCLHYGMFMMGHLIFLLVIYSDLIPGLPASSVITAKTVLGAFDNLPPDGAVLLSFVRDLFTFESVIDFFDSEVFVIILLFVSHVAAFFIFFVKGKQYVTGEIGRYFIRPYKRIILMHLTIIFGGIIIMATGWNAAKFIVFWVLLKVIVDLRLHFNDYGIESGTGLKKTRS